MNPWAKFSQNTNISFIIAPVLPASVKYLGIIIGQHFKWDKHIAHISTRLHKTMQKFVICLFSLVQSVIEYGIIAWGGITKTIPNPLFLLQKHIIKICLRKSLD